MDFRRGSFRAKGDILEIFPSHHEDRSWKVSFFGDDIEKISEIDPLTGENLGDLEQIRIFANFRSFFASRVKRPAYSCF